MGAVIKYRRWALVHEEARLRRKARAEDEVRRIHIAISLVQTHRVLRVKVIITKMVMRPDAKTIPIMLPLRTTAGCLMILNCANSVENVYRARPLQAEKRGEKHRRLLAFYCNFLSLFFRRARSNRRRVFVRRLCHTLYFICISNT